MTKARNPRTDAASEILIPPWLHETLRRPGHYGNWGFYGEIR